MKTPPKKVIYNVQCVHNQEHVFEKAFLIEGGSEDEQTDAEAYCPFCDKFVTVTVQGKLVVDKELLRKFGLE